MSKKLESDDKLEFPTEVRVSSNSGVFGNCDFLTDKEKSELNEMAAKKMEENDRITDA